MEPEKIIEFAASRGITIGLSPNTCDLTYTADRPLTEKEIKVIADNKPALLAYLALKAAQEVDDPYRDGLGLKWAIVNSRVLGEEIVIAKDGAVVPPTATEGRVVYFEGELRDFMAEKPTQGHIRLVHESKKVFGGTIESEGA